MSRSFSSVSAETRLNSVHPRPAKVEIDLNRIDGAGDAGLDADLLSLIQTAIRRSGLKQEYLATLSGVKPSQLSGALSGHGSFNVIWLNHWPTSFWNEFLPLLRAEKEGSAESRRDQRKERLIAAIGLLLAEAM